MARLLCPAHISQAAVRNQPVTYTWRGGQDFVKESPKLRGLFQGLSLRARLACVAGMAEWVYWRHADATDFDAPLMMIEAAWAANLDIGYVDIPTVYEFEARKGPVDGVLRASKDTVESALRSFKAESPVTLGTKAGHLYFLARHVVPDQRAFGQWLTAVTGRLADISPHVAGQLGASVPREAMDTAAGFDKADAPMLLAEFRRELTPAANCYLAAAVEPVG
ncbi:hypothetical protein [Catenulispora rubra]|uniref:hypothetical protein n=1 Tax=Catenulispora rubra TaxID=280293 RepID=UPI001892499B|nr:hypothetical protein [Catenulispora rubra]